MTNENITCHDLVEAYGRAGAAEIITRKVTQTIITKQRIMRAGKPLYTVFLKDPIAGKLIINTKKVLNLQYVGKDGKRRDWFKESEIDAMRRIMPGFDKYYEVRVLGYANEED